MATFLTGLPGLRCRAETPPAGQLWLLLFLATALHGVLDAMTTGGEAGSRL